MLSPCSFEPIACSASQTFSNISQYLYYLGSNAIIFQAKRYATVFFITQNFFLLWNHFPCIWYRKEKLLDCTYQNLDFFLCSVDFGQLIFADEEKHLVQNVHNHCIITLHLERKKNSLIVDLDYFLLVLLLLLFIRLWTRSPLTRKFFAHRGPGWTKTKYFSNRKWKQIQISALFSWLQCDIFLFINLIVSIQKKNDNSTLFSFTVIIFQNFDF